MLSCIRIFPGRGDIQAWAAMDPEPIGLSKISFTNMSIADKLTEKTDNGRLRDLKTKKEVLKKLFFSTLYLSAFTFGGGYVIVTLMKQKFVDELHWIEEEEMLDLIAIAQSAPGAIAVNGAIVVGYKLSGIPGALVAILATILPPFLIITVISFFYELFRDNFVVSSLLSGMQAGVGAVIASTVWNMGGGVVKQRDPANLVIMLAAFVAACVYRVNVVYIILTCIAIGIVRTVITQRRKAK